MYVCMYVCIFVCVCVCFIRKPLPKPFNALVAFLVKRTSLQPDEGLYGIAERAFGLGVDSGGMGASQRWNQ